MFLYYIYIIIHIRKPVDIWKSDIYPLFAGVCQGKHHYYYCFQKGLDFFPSVLCMYVLGV